MPEKFTPRPKEEQRICTANLFLTIGLLAAAGTAGLFMGETMAGWMLFGCVALLAAVYFVMGKLDAGITPKALLSALCQPPLILYLAGGEENGMLWLALAADLILTGVYFRFWITLPQFLFTDIMLAVNFFLFPVSDFFPILGFQLMGAALLLTVWRGGVSWKKGRKLSEDLESFLELFGDLYLRLQPGFDRTLTRLEQLREQDELLGECSAVLCGEGEPVLSGTKKAAEILEQLHSGAAQESSVTSAEAIQIMEAQNNMKTAQKALEEQQRLVGQVTGILRCHQQDIRAIQMDARSMEHLTKQLYSLLRGQKDAARPTNGSFPLDSHGSMNL